MLPRAGLRVIRAVCSRGICFTSQSMQRPSHPLYPVGSKLVSESGLVHETAEVKAKKHFDQSDHEPTKANCYDSINIKVEGYDLVIVEKFSQTIHRFVLQQKIDVKEVYALPPEYTTVKHVVDKITTDAKQMLSDADLVTYTRIIQVFNLTSTFAPIVIQSLVQNVPPGVKLSFEKYTEGDYLKRYKENKELEAAKQDLLKLRGMR